jgi:hypothetical protein
MKKIIFALAAIAAMGMTQQASAGTICTLSYDVEGGGLQVLFGKYELSGPGSINCQGYAPIPVTVTFGGAPLAPVIGAGWMRGHGATAGFGINSDPSALIGDYVVAGGSLALFVGLTVQGVLHGAQNGFDIGVSFTGDEGFGLELGVTTANISEAPPSRLRHHKS